jgi:hypothetical protein
VAEPRPPQGPEEVLEELDDDAIVAQQATAHSPAPRVQVNEEARTIVVSEPPPDSGDTARLPRMAPGRNDPTLVLRAVRPPISASPLPSPRRARLPGWVPWLIWGIAGLLAFGFGAFLALTMAKKDAAPVPAATGKPRGVTR